MAKKKLPTKVRIDWDDLYLDDQLNNAICEYLSNKYGYCVNSYTTSNTLEVSDIEWDVD